MGRVAVSHAIAISLATAAITAQPQALRFEVASVRVITDGVPMSSRLSDSRVDISQPLRMLLLTAFRVQDHQLSAPADLNRLYIDLQATMPAGATVVQVPEMLQTLLAERFELAYHRESRPTDAYALVTGPDGVKMREVKPVDELRRAFPSEPPVNGRARNDTTSETPEGTVRTMSIPGGLRRITSRTMYERTTTPSGGLIVNATRMSMTELTSVLQRNVDLPIVDQTDLAGLYQFKVELPYDAAAAVLAAAARAYEISKRGGNADAGTAGIDRAPGVPTKALESIGLKLEKRRLPIEVVVVDKISRTPTEN
jgi:uncharacterized protein (TIGR03435 family)